MPDNAIRRAALVAAVIGAAMSMLVPASSEAAAPCPVRHRDVQPPKTPTRAAIVGPNSVRIPPGQRATVSYALELPPPARRVDVFFLMDTTSSMFESICGLQKGIFDIAYSLAAGGFDARFGLGDFRDYDLANPTNASNPYGSKGDWAYKRVRDMGPVDASMEDAVRSLNADGGGDLPEAGLPALYQAATGEGQTVAGNPSADIPADQQVHFRSDALRLIISISDASFHQQNASAPNYPGPTLDDTIAALRSRNILQLGLVPNSGDEGGTEVREIARGTGAVATEPVDCNGDGRADIAVGGPLVCDVDVYGGGGSIAPAVLSVVNAVHDWTAVSFKARASQRVVDSLAPSTVPIDLRHVSPANFSVTYSCRGLAGTIVPVRLSATLRHKVVAESTVDVTCVLEPPPLFVPPPRAVAQPPPPAQNIAPQVHTQVQGQVHAANQLSAAVMPETQPELATQLNMSRRLPSAVPGLAVAFVTGCAAIAFAKIRVQTEPIRRKR